MVAVPSTLYPVAERFVNVVRELTPGTPPTGTGVTIPLTQFEPDDKPVWAEDKAWRGSMVEVYDLIQGPEWTEHTWGGPVYGDTIGHHLYNILGDLVATGTASTPTNTLSAGIAAGVTALPVASGGASFTNGTFVQVDSGANAEVVQVGSGSTATSIVLAATTPTRFAHLTAAAITTVVAPFTNTFSVLNAGNGQPPTHTWYDRTNVPGSANKNAVQYPFGCMTEMVLTGNAEQIFTWTGKGVSWAHRFPATAPTASISSVRATPAWRATIGLGGPASGGTLVNWIKEFQLTLSRMAAPYPTLDGSQDPFVIGRGPLGAAFKFTVSPAIDETVLTDMLGNVQPQFQVVYSNGLAGAANITYTINCLFAGFKVAKLAGGSELFGYEAEGTFIANTTNAGNSLGYSPVSITVQNGVPTY